MGANCITIEVEQVYEVDSSMDGTLSLSYPAMSQGISLLFKPTYEIVFDLMLIKTSPGEREGIWPIVELPMYCWKPIAM